MRVTGILHISIWATFCNHVVVLYIVQHFVRGTIFSKHVPTPWWTQRQQHHAQIGHWSMHSSKLLYSVSSKLENRSNFCILSNRWICFSFKSLQPLRLKLNPSRLRIKLWKKNLHFKMLLTCRIDSIILSTLFVVNKKFCKKQKKLVQCNCITNYQVALKP